MKTMLKDYTNNAINDIIAAGNYFAACIPRRKSAAPSGGQAQGFARTHMVYAVIRRDFQRVFGIISDVPEK